MAVNLAPIGNDAPYVDSNGDPFVGAKLHTYTAGSSTPQNTYTTSSGLVANDNPMTLNAGGYPTSSNNQVQVWLTAGVSYKFELKNPGGTTIWTRDSIVGINDTAVTIDQWVAGPAPTFLSTTSFSLVGDQTSTFHVGRRVKTTNSGGTIYSTITASAFGAVTTVTVVNDSGVLDSGLSAVSYGLLSATNPSTPLLDDSYPIVSGSADKTKKLRLEADGITTATTRVWTVQNYDIAPGKYPTRQTLTSGSGATYTTPAGTVRIFVRMVGGGGGGAGGGASGANGNAGGAGGNTVFNTATANGGGAGQAATASTGGTGGATTGLTTPVSIPGGDGSAGTAQFGNTGANGGCGAPSPFGGSGAGSRAQTAGTAAKTNSGSGGGGGGGETNGGGGGFGGGGGAAGQYIEGLINAPAGTYTYTIGSAGTVGTAGGSGGAGGLGGAGLIVVDEFYD